MNARLDSKTVQRSVVLFLSSKERGYYWDQGLVIEIVKRWCVENWDEELGDKSSLNECNGTRKEWTGYSELARQYFERVTGREKRRKRKRKTGEEDGERQNVWPRRSIRRMRIRKGRRARERERSGGRITLV